MASNQYTNVSWDKPMSSYVGLPLDYLMKVGQVTQGRFDEGKALESDLGALGQGIKSAPMYEQSRQNFIKEYNSKINNLVEESKGNYGDPEFKRKARNLINEFKSRPEINAFANTLKSYQDWESQVKSPENERNLDWTYQMDPSGQFKQLDVVRQGVYNPKFTKYDDYTKAAKDVVGNIAESGYTKESGLNMNNFRINNGETEVYDTRTNSYVGVSDPRVKQLSSMLSQNYAQTNAGKHHLQSLLGQDIDYNQLSRMAQSGDQQAINTKNAVDQEFANHIYRANANQIGGKSSSTIDYHYEHNRQAAKGNDINDLINGLTSSTEESKTSNAIESDINFKNLSGDGVFTNKNGIFTFNPNALSNNSTRTTGFHTGYMGPGMGTVTYEGKNVTSAEKLKEFNNQIIRMSKAVGVDPKSLHEVGKDGISRLNNKAIGELASAYNSLAKFRTLDLNLSAMASNSEGKLATKNWDNITKLNPETGKPTDNEQYKLSGKDEIISTTRRVINGKTYIEGYIKKGDGTENIPVIYRPNTIEKNKVFDGLAELQQLSIDNLSKDNPKYEGSVRRIGDLDFGVDMKIEGTKNVGQNRFVKSLVDPNNKMNTRYLLVDGDNNVLDIKQSIGDMKKVIEQHYYKNVPEGSSELQILLGNKDLFKENN